MILLIAGSRDFTDYEWLSEVVTQVLSETIDEVTVLSGTARGADQLGERFAEERGLEIIRCPAEWERYGKSAGYKRNLVMAKVATHAIIFWDGESRGTRHMINLCTDTGVKLRVINTNQKGTQ